MGKVLAEPFLLMHHSIYTAYRKYKEIPAKNRIKGRENLRLVITTICKHIGREIVEREAGVHIKRLGYFFVWKMPRKMPYKMFVRGQKVKDSYNYHTNHHMYSLIFKPVINTHNPLMKWSMDNSFVRDICRGVKDKIRSGHKYKMYAYSLRGLK